MIIFYFYHFSRYSSNHCIVRNVLCYHSIGTNCHIIAYPDTSEYFAAQSKVTVVTNYHWAIVRFLCLIPEHNTRQHRAILANPHIRPNMNKVTSMIDSKPWTYGVGIYCHPQLEAQSFIPEEMPQIQEFVLFLIVFHIAQVADIVVYKPCLVVENPIFKRRFSIVETFQVCKEYFIYPPSYFSFFS